MCVVVVGRHNICAWWFSSADLVAPRATCTVCACVVVAVVSVARCVCSSGGLAAEEPGECSERGPMWSHPHAEEKAPEHPELHTGSAQECPLETTGPAGKHQYHMDAFNRLFCTS